MDLFQKLTILANSAKYDVSCASSGSNRANRPGGVAKFSFILPLPKDDDPE